jgi:transcription initiation factor TFIID subunit 1
VRDPAVIAAYIRRRQAIEEEQTLTDALAPTGDAERDKRAMERINEEIARRKKNQERRLHRKNQKIAKEGGTPLQLNRPMKPDTTRKCGHCGQMGHMKTNRKCPRWLEFNSGDKKASTSNAASASSPPGAGGATSPPPATPGLPSLLSFNNRQTSFAPSPLATSPPVFPEPDDDDHEMSAPPSATTTTGPKIKLSLKRGP